MAPNWRRFFSIRRHSYGPLSIDSTVEEDLAPVQKGCTVCCTRRLEKCSTKCLAIISVCWLALITTLGIGLSLYLYLYADIVIDKSVDAFSIPNHESSKRASALEMAMREYNDPGMHLVTKRSAMNLDLEYRRIRDSEYSTRTRLDLSRRQKRSPYSDDGLTQRVLRWKLQLAFIATGDEPNIMSPDRLHTIHNIEVQIRNHSNYEDFCWKDVSAEVRDPTILSNHGGCSPINSLLTYFYPTVDSSGQVHYNGLGEQAIDIDSALDLAMSYDTFYYFVGDQFNKTSKRGNLLHSEVFFGAPLDGYMDVIDRPEEQNEKFKQFIISYVDVLSKVSTDKVQVLYGGSQIYDYEVDTGFWTDMRLATVSLATIAVLMYVLTSLSLWLTFWGLVSIVLSFPVAMVTYRLVFGIKSLGILNGAAAFVIVGIGVDDVFVFINTFRQTNHDVSIYKRMVLTVKTAGRTTFFTSFTTSAAFAANISSSIPAVHNFGVFMSLIVASCWLTVLVTLPAVLIVWSYWLVRAESLCYRRCDCSEMPQRQEMTQFFDAQNNGGHSSTGCHGDDDVAMLDGGCQGDDDDDAPLLRMDSVVASDTVALNTGTVFHVKK